MFGLGIPELIILALVVCVALGVFRKPSHNDNAVVAKLCPHCGQSNLKKDKFCKACGKEI